MSSIEKIGLICVKSKSKKNPNTFRCHIPTEDEINPFRITEQASPYQAIREEPKKSSFQRSSSTVATIVFASLIGCFGFAIATYLMYTLYDYTVNDPYPYSLTRVFISIAFLVGMMFLLVILTYIIFKRNLSPKKSESGGELWEEAEAQLPSVELQKQTAPILRKPK